MVLDHLGDFKGGQRRTYTRITTQNRKKRITSVACRMGLDGININDLFETIPTT